jgi:methionyl-tRNA formyltransferase
VWSHIEGTRKGVTIHYIDKGVDSGDIIARKRVRFGKGHTLRSSYDRLQDEIVKLFVANWPMIRNGRCRRARQDPRKGTIHYDRDRGKFLPLIEKKGWDTSIEELSKAREGK